MDTSDTEIGFDAAGVCSHCHKFETVQRHQWKPDEEGARLWEEKLELIRSSGAGREYDCIIGLSGGADSSYLAIKAAEWNLRPLVVHVDAGWNSELATANIERVVKHCGYDLHTVVIDWPEMRDLQLAYLKAGVANQDVPQDHAFFANLYKFAVDKNVRYILSGGNIASESVIASSWEGAAMDSISLKAIHKAFGTITLKSYRTISFMDYYLIFPFFRGMRTLRPLNYMPYRKRDAIEALQAIGWRPYGRKHGESRFTKLFQNYYLPTKFGYDKRRTHLSSLILSDDISREAAIKELEAPLYDLKELASDITYFCKKLGITEEEFHIYVKSPNRQYIDFDNWDSRQNIVKRLQRFVAKILGRRVNIYS